MLLSQSIHTDHFATFMLDGEGDMGVGGDLNRSPAVITIHVCVKHLFVCAVDHKNQSAVESGH